MKVWMVFVQADGHTWLEAAWDDESTAENPRGWEEAVEKAVSIATDNNGEWRVMEVTVPGVFEAFEVPEVTAQ